MNYCFAILVINIDVKTCNENNFTSSSPRRFSSCQTGLKSRLAKSTSYGVSYSLAYYFNKRIKLKKFLFEIFEIKSIIIYVYLDK